MKQKYCENIDTYEYMYIFMYEILMLCALKSFPPYVLCYVHAAYISHFRAPYQEESVIIENLYIFIIIFCCRNLLG